MTLRDDRGTKDLVMDDESEGPPLGEGRLISDDLEGDGVLLAQKLMKVIDSSIVWVNWW